MEDPAGDEIVLIVDDENRPVGEAQRRRMRAEHLPHRATYIFVLDSDGRVLVQRRTDTKDLFPGYYDLAAGGVVAAGESYEECAAREAEEELGIRDTPIAPRFDFHYADANTRCFGRVFVCRHDGRSCCRRRRSRAYASTRGRRLRGARWRRSRQIRWLRSGGCWRAVRDRTKVRHDLTRGTDRPGAFGSMT